MILKDLKKVWISEYETVNDHGEKTKKWKYKGLGYTVTEINATSVQNVDNIGVLELATENNKGVAYLNLQSDLNELDRNSAGQVDYDILNARTNKAYNIEKDNGISLTDISQLESFVPDYRVTDCPKIGNTYLYKLEKYNGE